MISKQTVEMAIKAVKLVKWDEFASHFRDENSIHYYSVRQMQFDSAIFELEDELKNMVEKEVKDEH